MSLHNCWRTSFARKNRRLKELNRFRPRAEALEDRVVPAGSDAFATAPLMSGNTWSDTDTNSDASGEVGEPNHANVADDGTGFLLDSIWWNWTPSVNGTCYVNTFGSDFDTVLAVYTGAAVNSLTPVASNDDFGGSTSLVGFYAFVTDTYRIAVDGSSAAVGNITINLNFTPNSPPIAEANGPYGVSEGSAVNLDSSGSSDPDGLIFTYHWDFDYDGVSFQVDATGPSPSFPGFDGPATITVALRVYDTFGDSTTDTATVNVSNVAPTATIGGDTDGVPGQDRNFTATADDLSAADDAAGFTYTFDWDDGSTDTVIAATTNNGAGVTAEHIFTAAGTYNVTVTATDKDNGVSTVQTHVVTITNTQMQGTELVMSGAANFNDKMKVSPNGTGTGAVKTVINKAKETFAGVTRIILFGLSGNDKLTATATLLIPVSMFGGDGNDKLSGGGAANIVVGGAGNDKIKGGHDRDLLIGGDGIDKITAKNGEDLLISEFTDHDSDGNALNAIMAEWTSGNDYDTRINNLLGGGGANGATALNGTTVDNDADIDTLIGQGDRDWFLNSTGDLIKDLANDEAVTTL